MLTASQKVISSRRKRIAVVGAGVAGLSSAWLLSRKHDVVLYEEESWLGGHAHTVDVTTPFGSIPVDTGFIVFNPGNYPNFTALLDTLKVRSKGTNMSFSASIDNGAFEYSSSAIGLFGQVSNLGRPAFWRMLADIVRFYRHGESLVDSRSIEGETLGGFLDRNGYSQGLVDHHILPMCAAIWSCSAETIREFPMRAFVRFFSNHNLFKIGRPSGWRTVDGGSRAYVSALLADMVGKAEIRQGARSIRRHPGQVMVEDAGGVTQAFDDVVLATHADRALSLLSDADALERSVLGAFRYSTNRTVLHEDPALMPRRRATWSCWNYLDFGSETRDGDLCVTYWMNRLQGLDRRQQLFITLNPPREPRDSALKREFTYRHPIFDQAALDAQKELWRLQGRNGTHFCGSYFSYGFHEDALQSGLAAAEGLGVSRPWTLSNPSSRLIHEPELAVAAQ